MPRFRLFAVPIALAALAAGVWFARGHYAPAASDAAALAALHQASYPDPQGRAQALAQWAGRLRVVNFWASWCAPCREEMPDFDALARRYRHKGVEFIGIAVDTEANVQAFLQKQPVSYPILIGGGNAHLLARQLGNATGALPYTLVLDREGRVVIRHLGRLPRATLDTVLRENLVH
ncbi:MAG: TlpA family protein disulfide reductase [Thiobacillus sp.]